MNTQLRFVILIALVAFGAGGCETHVEEPGPLERAARRDQTLTSAPPFDAISVSTDRGSERSEGGAAPKHDEPILDESPGVERDDVNSEEPGWQPVLQSDGEVSIQRLVTTRDVNGREPVAASSVFALGEAEVYAFIETQNFSEEEATLTVFFIAPSGKATGGVQLAIPPRTPRWRTWAFTRFADELGLWRVEVRSSTGVLLGALPFEMVESC